MSTRPKTSELARAASISRSYASEILSDPTKLVRNRRLAIRIYRTTGWRHASIAHFSEADIDVLERIEAA